MASFSAAGLQLIDWMDQIPSLAFNPWFWVVLVLIATYFVIRRFWRWWKRKPLMTPQELLKESAKRLAEALDARDAVPIKALKLASEAHVLAQTARDLTSSPQTLSEQAGVNVGDYAAYASSILTGIEQRLESRIQPNQASRT